MTSDAQGPAARLLADAGPGDLVEFGRYPQEAGAADPAPILWRVLERTDRLVVVSDRILTCRRYHDAPGATTWRDSTLRRWLNTAFLSDAFSDAERALVSRTRCSDNGPGTPATTDRAYLLSVSQVRSLTHAGSGAGVDRRAIATPYARGRTADGCHLYVYDKAVEKDYLVIDGTLHGCSWWWTRTQPQAQDGTSPRAAFVGARGDVKSYGRVDIARYGVRPALTIDVPR